MAKGQKPAFETWRSTKNGQFYAHFQAANSRVVWVTEGYKNEEDAEDAIELLIETIEGGDYDVKPRADVAARESGEEFPPNLTDPWDLELGKPSA